MKLSNVFILNKHYKADDFFFWEALNADVVFIVTSRTQTSKITSTTN